MQIALEARNLVKQYPGVVAVDPSVRTAAQARYRGANWGTAVEGATPSFLHARNWGVAEGEFFSARHGDYHG